MSALSLQEGNFIESGNNRSDEAKRLSVGIAKSERKAKE